MNLSCPLAALAPLRLLPAGVHAATGTQLEEILREASSTQRRRGRHSQAFATCKRENMETFRLEHHFFSFTRCHLSHLWGISRSSSNEQISTHCLHCACSRAPDSNPFQMQHGRQLHATLPTPSRNSSPFMTPSDSMISPIMTYSSTSHHPPATLPCSTAHSPTPRARASPSPSAAPSDPARYHPDSRP